MRLLFTGTDPGDLGAALAGRGHRMLTAGDVREALALAAVADLDAVVIDFSLQAVSGSAGSGQGASPHAALLKSLRADCRTRALPVLLLSAPGTDPIQGLLLGATDHLPRIAGTMAVATRLEELVDHRSASPGGLSGRLAKGTLIAVLEGLERERSSGILRLIGEVRDGWIELDRGRFTAARYGLLEGWGAMLAILDLDGPYVFEPRRAGDGNASVSIAGSSSLTSLGLRLEQLRERLERCAALLPEPEAGLRVRSDLSPELAALDDLPYREIHARIGALPGVTCEELLGHEIGPEVHVKLALAMLIKTSAVTVSR